MSDEVLLDRRGSTLVITLNRPEVRNAVNGALARAVAAAMDLLDADAHLRVGVLTGAGRGFCAGNDLRNVGGGDSPMTARGFAGIVERPSRKPLIAAVEGFAAGGGFEIALACDLIVAGRTARFMLPEVQRGLVAGGGGIPRLLDRAPRGLAVEMLLTGDARNAEALGAAGVVDAVVDDGAALDAALDLAARIARNSPAAVAATKAIMGGLEQWPRAEFFARQRPILTEVVRGPEAREGARAFLEKRSPRWAGEPAAQTEQQGDTDV